MFTKRTSWARETNSLSQAVAEAAAQGRLLVDLTESNPTRVGLGGGDLVPLLGDPRGAAYAPSPLGDPTARAAVARYYAEKGHLQDPARICLTASTSEAYAWIFKLLCDPGDHILVPAPSYPLFEFLADLEDVTIDSYRLVQEDGFRIDLPGIEAAVGERTRAIVMVHPNNPTGSFVRCDEARQLTTMAAERGLALVVDEVFGDYVMPDAPADRFPCFAGNEGALTFVLSGLSKVVALPQLKLGWIAASGPTDLVAEAIGRLEVIADTFLSVNTPVQVALPKILAQRGEIQAAIRERVVRNLAAIDRALEELGTEAPVRRLRVPGGWSAVLEVPRTRGEDGWTDTLVREECVVVHPGYFFDFDRGGHLVLSLLPEEAIFREAVGRVLRRVALG